MDMVDRDTVIVDLSPQAADPRLKKITDSRSPETQKCNIQEIDEGKRITRKIFHFENCGTVYMDSLNAHNVKIKNCGNNVPNVTYHRPRIIGNGKILHSQSYAVSSGPQNATGSMTAPTGIDKSNPINVHLQMNALSPPRPPQPISPSHLSGDHIHHNIKHLEQLLDSSLATVAIIQLSGSPLPDVLTPRAYDAFKALYALAALDASTSSIKPLGSEIPTRFTLSNIVNECPYSSNRLPPLPTSSLAVPHTHSIYISIPLNYVILFSWAGLAAFSCLVMFFNLPRLFEITIKVHHEVGGILKARIYI